MINGTARITTLTMTTTAGPKGFPFWVYVIWTVVGLLLTITVIVISYFCVYNSRKKSKNTSTRPPSSHINDVDLMEAYNPQGLITHLHGIGGQTKQIFSTSFVDHMRIPRAMEVKMAQTVSQMNSNFMYAAYNAPLPQRSTSEKSPQMSRRDETLLSASDWGSVSPVGERKVPSRQSSFRLQDIMDERERAERINKEKMLVYELREKLRRQGKIEE